MKKVPPISLLHNPCITNNKGMTVAMKLAINGLGIPIKWQHDKNLISKDGSTVAMYYAYNKHQCKDGFWE